MFSIPTLSAKTLFHGTRLFSEINRAPTSSLSTQAYRGKSRSASELSALCFKFVLVKKLARLTRLASSTCPVVGYKYSI